MRVFIIAIMFVSSSAFGCAQHACGGRMPLVAEETIKKDPRFAKGQLEYKGSPKLHHFRVRNGDKCEDVAVNVKVPKNCKLTGKVVEVKPCQK